MQPLLRRQVRSMPSKIISKARRFIRSTKWRVGNKQLRYLCGLVLLLTLAINTYRKLHWHLRPEVLQLMKDDRVRKRLLTVKCSSGFGNRLRAFASAAALAEETNMKLQIVWVKDEHLHAGMDDIFDTSGLTVFDFDIVRSLGAETLIYDDVAARTINTVEDQLGKDIYINTPFLLRSVTKYSFARVIYHLRQLKLSDKVMKYHNALVNELPLPLKFYTAVHIRKETNFQRDVPHSKHSVLPGGASVVEDFRERCTATSFIQVMRRHLKNHRGATFLLATDTPEVYGRLQKEFGDRVHTLDPEMSRYCRTEVTREFQCIAFAAAELHALAKTHAGVIFSHFSSYSDIITWMSSANPRNIFNGCVDNHDTW